MQILDESESQFISATSNMTICVASRVERWAPAELSLGEKTILLGLHDAGPEQRLAIASQDHVAGWSRAGCWISAGSLAHHGGT